MAVLTSTALLIAAGVSAAAAAGTTIAQRNAARDARIDQSHRLDQAKQDEENAKIQKDTATAARAARAQQQALAGGGYQSTIGTSPLGLSGGAGTSMSPTKEKLGE
jgi:Flp pilus assembly protein TadB